MPATVSRFFWYYLGLALLSSWGCGEADEKKVGPECSTDTLSGGCVCERRRDHNNAECSPSSHPGTTCCAARGWPDEKGCDCRPRSGSCEDEIGDWTAVALCNDPGMSSPDEDCLEPGLRFKASCHADSDCGPVLTCMKPCPSCESTCNLPCGGEERGDAWCESFGAGECGAKSCSECYPVCRSAPTQCGP